MNYKNIRNTFTDRSTIGNFLINENFHCFCLEDVDRKLEWGGVKIDKQTAIPRGKYKLVIDFSNRFQRLMPHILAVPQFSGIRIHKGERAEDTEGCPVLGAEKMIDQIHNCQGVYNSFFASLKHALGAGETCSIEVV